MSGFYVNKNYLKHSWFVVSRYRHPDYMIEVDIGEKYGHAFYCERENQILEVNCGYAHVMLASGEYVDLGPIA